MGGDGLVTNLKGIFTDGFIGLPKSDIAHAEYDCTIDLDNEEMTLPSQAFVSGVKPNIATFETTAQVTGRVLTAPYNHVLALAQTAVTGQMLVNPYAVYNPFSLIKLDPAVDNWVDVSKVTINKAQTNTYSLRRWWYHRGERWAESERQKWLQITGDSGGSHVDGGYNNTKSSLLSSDVVMDAAVS